MAIFSRLLLSATALLLLSSSALAQNFNRTASNVQAPTQAAIDRLNTIDHFIVLMLENESFDQLFPNFPGAENLLDWMLGRSRNGIPYFPQVDLKGNTLSTLPVPQCSGVPCGNFPAAGLANAPYLATQYWPENATSSFDVTHRYYQEQWQINGGAMNQYVQWGAQATVNGAIQATGSGWAMQFWNVTAQYMGQLGMNFTVFDSFFHSYFGGSTPGAISVFAGDLPAYNGSNTGCPINFVAAFNGSAPTPDGQNFTLDGILDANCRMINDAYAPGFGPTNNNFLPTNQPTIVDLLDAKNVSWAWFAQNWNSAYSLRPNGLSTAHFAYHHHAPLYYQRFSNFTSPDFLAHMQDELNFFQMLGNNTGLPSVSYVRPSPDDDMHPAQNNPVLAQAHLKQYFDAIFASQYWLSNKTAILITFDENGGYFDHVPPYVGDADGPGTRVPALMISPYHMNGGVNHYPYENLSFLKLLQTRYNLTSNTIAPQRVNTVRDLTNSFAEPSSALPAMPSSSSSSASPSSSSFFPIFSSSSAAPAPRASSSSSAPSSSSSSPSSSSGPSSSSSSSSSSTGSVNTGGVAPLTPSSASAAFSFSAALFLLGVVCAAALL